MPYIKNDMREFASMAPATDGELNFSITRICDNYLKTYGLSYHHINEVIGALECAKLEMYRRIAAPYEDKKCAENGDVYRSGK